MALVRDLCDDDAVSGTNGPMTPSSSHQLETLQMLSVPMPAAPRAALPVAPHAAPREGDAAMAAAYLSHHAPAYPTPYRQNHAEAGLSEAGPPSEEEIGPPDDSLSELLASVESAFPASFEDWCRDTVGHGDGDGDDSTLPQQWARHDQPLLTPAERAVRNFWL